MEVAGEPERGPRPTAAIALGTESGAPWRPGPAPRGGLPVSPGRGRPALLSGLRRRLLGISQEDVWSHLHGAAAAAGGLSLHLKYVVQHFVRGYNAALEERSTGLASRFSGLTARYRGFAFEGAAMALTLLDALFPWRHRLQGLLAADGSEHCYLLHVGAGWALARTPMAWRERLLRRLDPVLRWLAYDGFGFHHGFFHSCGTVGGQLVPAGLRGYSRRAFDQGLGRSLWFVFGADIEAITETVRRFPVERRGDLWSGVGLACTYAGGVGATEIAGLRQACGSAWPEVAQGAAFAAEARERARIPTPQTDLACHILCGLRASEAARVTRRARCDLTPEDGLPRYEVWRRRVQHHFGAGWGD